MQEERCSSETLSSCGNVDNNDNSTNDIRQFQMNVPPLINKQRNACFRQTDAMRIYAFQQIKEKSCDWIIFSTMKRLHMPASLLPPRAPLDPNSRRGLSSPLLGIISISLISLPHVDNPQAPCPCLSPLPSMGLPHRRPTHPLPWFCVLLLLLTSHSLFLLLPCLSIFSP